MLARRAVAERKAVRCRDACALTSINNYGTLLQAQGKLSEAGPLLLEALQRSRATLGDTHSTLNICWPEEAESGEDELDT